MVGGFDCRESWSGGKNIPFVREKPQIIIQNEDTI
jgi:hypothetical protein